MEFHKNHSKYPSTNIRVPPPALGNGKCQQEEVTKLKRKRMHVHIAKMVLRKGEPIFTAKAQRALETNFHLFGLL